MNADQPTGRPPLIDGLPPALVADLQALGWDCAEIGTSAEGRPLHGLSYGAASLPLVSIVAGAHPDEPAGPLAAVQLAESWSAQPLCDRVRLAIVPQLDVDGSAAQAGWLTDWQGAADPLRYLGHALRRQPGEDREFAWPGAPWGGCVLPENRAAANFLDAAGPAIAHLSLHGMAIAEGAWYLLDSPAMRDASLWAELRDQATELGLGLHEFVRHGDKGFRRAGLGFCTTPSSAAMRRHFLAVGDPVTAAGFGWSSMESARDRARRAGRAAPLCAVSEFPLFRSPAAARGQLGGRQLRQALQERSPAQILDWFASIGLTAVSMATQTAGMCGMVEAVIAAALRRGR